MKKHELLNMKHEMICSTWDDMKSEHLVGSFLHLTKNQLPWVKYSNIAPVVCLFESFKHDMHHCSTKYMD